LITDLHDPKKVIKGHIKALRQLIGYPPRRSAAQSGGIGRSTDIERTGSRSLDSRV
jgi:hypothetical protein